MIFGLGRKQPPPLGIDIGSTAIKLVELSRADRASGAGHQVTRYAIEPLVPSAMAEKKIADIEAVGQGIARALRRAGSKTKRAAVAISGSAVITKTITLAGGLSEADIEAQIQLEADQYIPFPLEEVNIDFDIIGPSPANPGMVDVLLAATRRENVEDRIAALEAAGLKAEIVDVEAYAMELACNQILGGGPFAEPSVQTLAVADIGATTTTLHVMRNGQVAYTREQKFGGLQLINEVQQRHGISRDEATTKVVNGDWPAGFETEILTPFREAMVQQIGRALQFFYSATTINRVDRILLAGAAASLPKLDRLIAERLEITTSVGNPFAHMTISKDLSSTALNRDAPALMIAAGLALRGCL
ncbi:pilus assembly protein PilM [Thioalkalicoccus limnaeus]|uniref:Pilus assembly protein PilM n=1 Tax=Thioalkalicoccus limnaeus TaxID=120681 RepID=A0ABV4BBB7_9GAMM